MPSGHRPKPLDDVVRRHMETQPRSDTKPEVNLRRALHRRGLRYRVGVPVPGAPRRTIDIAFTKMRLAVFVDGCFWHGCPEHGVAPKNNSEWWSYKLAGNRERDESTSALLANQGWRVVRVWEHQPLEEQVAVVLDALHGAADPEFEHLAPEKEALVSPPSLEGQPARVGGSPRGD